MTKAVVTFSGGQDSTTCLLWARERFDVIAISFDYGQRHTVELTQAKIIAAELGIEHHIVNIRALGEIAPSALTRADIPVTATGGPGGLPSTFVPGRNLVFLTLAAAFAAARGFYDVVGGMCQMDDAGYPDCRRDTIKTLAQAIRLGLDWDLFHIHTPLMCLTKAETVALARQLGGLSLMALTHTCYEGRRPACGKCPACRLRLKGFADAGLTDPLEYT